MDAPPKDARKDMLMGLNDVARRLVRGEHAKRYEWYYGNNNKYGLYQYTFRDDTQKVVRVLTEVVQNERQTASHRVFFLALKDQDGKWVPGTRWPDKEAPIEKDSRLCA